MKKKYRFICLLQKSLYLCIRKTKSNKNNKIDYNEYTHCSSGSPAYYYYSRRGRVAKR